MDDDGLKWTMMDKNGLIRCPLLSTWVHYCPFEYLNVDTVFAHFTHGFSKSLLIYCAQSISGKTQSDEPIFLCKPEAFLLYVRQKAAFCFTCHFKTDPFLLLRNTTNGIRIAARRSFFCDGAYSRHECNLRSKRF